MRKLLCGICVVLVASFVLMPFNRVYGVENSISAKAYVLIEASTARVIAAKNENEQRAMASTTKIMTALLALEQDNIFEKFVVDANAIKTAGTSMGLIEGDKASLYDLSCGMLLPSGNDGANAAAVKIAGSIASFAEIMNSRASEIGMKNTGFTNPSGLPDNSHYSSAYDMALLAREALQNSIFKDICSQKSIRVEYGNPPYRRTLSNHNRLVSSYEGCIGVKTGFTKAAGRCLVSAAERNGVTLICVTLNASNDWQDHTKLLDMGFGQVLSTEIATDVSGLAAGIVGSKTAQIPIKASGKAYSCVEHSEDLRKEICLKSFYYAPVKQGDILGEIRYYYGDYLVGQVDLTADGSAEYYIKEKKENKFFEWVKDFFEKHIR